ncbi:MAG TPA: antitoxin family protein [Planctomycetaceae bacterium]
MAITVEATYEDGTLKLERPLPLKERERVRVTVQPAVSRARQTAGMIGWKGDVEPLERFALDPELDFPPPPETP